MTAETRERREPKPPEETALPAEFFETFPLYRKYPFRFASSMSRLKWPSLHLSCPRCERQATFTGRPYEAIPLQPNGPTSDSPTRLDGAGCLFRYTCQSCQGQTYFFLAIFAADRESITKVGQFPPLLPDLDPRIETALGSRSEYLKRGRNCEMQGYGIGAFAYYRRIVELIIDDLLDRISEVADEAEAEAYSAAVAEAKGTIVAAKKIETVKDYLPSALRPNGMNPLAALHGCLSEGIHSLDDDECSELAEDLRGILTFVVDQVDLILKSRESREHFTDSMQRILNRRAGSASS